MQRMTKAQHARRFQAPGRESSAGASARGMFVVRSGKETLSLLTSHEKGLNRREVEARKAAYGPNRIAAQETQDTLLRVVVRQFGSILILILLAAGGVSFLLGDALDGQVILLAVAINVVVGAYQEKKASQALSSLKKAVVTTARAWREGELVEVRQDELVPGDIVEVQAGDRVPADVRLLAAHELEANEAVLTGESHPQAKVTRALRAVPELAETVNMLFLGTTVTAGRGRGVVVATGANTEMGTIARLLAETEEGRTPLQNQLDQFAKHLLLLILAVVAMMFFVGVSRGRPLTEMFATSIAVAVSAIPEGLTIALTVILALGMQAILRKKGLVRSLLAAETLGATSVICTDKTGTLTRGEMEAVVVETWEKQYDLSRESSRNFLLRNSDMSLGNATVLGAASWAALTPYRLRALAFPRSGERRSDSLPRTEAKLLVRGARAGIDEASLSALLVAASLCNDAAVPGEEGKTVAVGNTTDRALMGLLVRAGVEVAALRREAPRADEVPFNSSSKFMATLHRGDPPMLYVKGAPEALIPHLVAAVAADGSVITVNQKERMRLEARVEEMSRKGLRVLCLAQRKEGEQVKKIPERAAVLEMLTFLGFVGIQDPLREEAREAIAAAQRAGITTVMITGDHRLTAIAIARELGLLTKGKEVVDGTELRSLKLQEFAGRVRNVAVYSRATPEDKLRIIEAWRKKGAVVAMTGDGVNDAPALKSADIGVALGSGTEVAKEASDLVLLENNFITITAAIREGRGVYETVQAVTVYLLSNCFSLALAVSAALLLGLPLPLLPAQILWMNMVTESLPALALTREPGSRGMMRERPRGRGAPLVTRGHRWVIIVVSITLAAFSLAVFYLYWRLFHSLELARTVSFTLLSISTLVYIFSLRSMKERIVHIPFFRNPSLIGAVCIGIALQAAAVYAPPLQRLFGTVPLLPIDWALIAAISGAFVLMIEWIKAVFRQGKKPEL